MKHRMEQFKSKSPAELNQELANMEKNLQKLRFDASFNKLKNTSEISQTKKNIARVRGLLNQK